MMHNLKNFFAVILVAGLAGWGSAWYFNPSSGSGAAVSVKNSAVKLPVKFTAMSATDGALPDFVKAADATVHAVVHVKTLYSSSQNHNPFYDPFGGFFGPQQPQRQPQQQGSGSGVIITEDGYIVTNNHVIDNASKVEVTLNDNRNFQARVVGADPSTDLALLKIDEKGLPFVTYGNSDDVKVGSGCSRLETRLT